MKKARPKANGGARRSTYYDRLTSRWQNIPILVWIVMLAGVTAGGLALFSSIRSTWSDLSPKNEARNIDISVRPKDPRFTNQGERTNWGGGSQSLFISSEPNGGINGIGDISTLSPSHRVYEVVGIKPVTLEVDAVFNSATAGIACVIEEWGVHLEEMGSPGAGSFLRYTTGGAEGVRTYGQCVIRAATGDYSISQYFKDDEEGPPPDKLYYLRPGEPISMEVDIGRASAAIASPARDETADSDAEKSAIILTLYAKVRVNGVSSVVKSKTSLLAVFPRNPENVPWKTFAWDSKDPNCEKFESLRSRSYGNGTELQSELR